MKFKCYKCQHEWDYAGDGEFYLTCPHCYYKLNIQKLKETALIDNDK